VGKVVRLSGGTVTLQDAVDAFLDHHDLARSTRRVYRASLAGLVAELGPATAFAELSGPRVAGWFRGRHATAAPATWNRELATLRAAVGWWRRRGWLASDPISDLERRRDQVDRPRALTRSQLERLFAHRDLPLRERTLWRLLYETAARANELLALDVEDLDLANRRARVHSKGGAVEWVFWQTGSAQLLPRLLAGRTGGPVFLGGRRPPARLPASTWTRPAGGRGCRTGGRPRCFGCAPGGRCISCATRLSLTPPRTAPTCRCCWPAPGTPRCARWSAMPAPDPRRSPATSPRPTRHAADHDPPAPHLQTGRCVRSSTAGHDVVDLNPPSMTRRSDGPSPPLAGHARLSRAS
jgi:integrase